MVDLAPPISETHINMLIQWKKQDGSSQTIKLSVGRNTDFLFVFQWFEAKLQINRWDVAIHYNGERILRGNTPNSLGMEKTKSFVELQGHIESLTVKAHPETLRKFREFRAKQEEKERLAKEKKENEKKEGKENNAEKAAIEAEKTGIAQQAVETTHDQNKPIVEPTNDNAMTKSTEEITIKTVKLVISKASPETPEASAKVVSAHVKAEKRSRRKNKKSNKGQHNVSIDSTCPQNKNAKL